MNLAPLPESDHDEWDRFVASSPTGTLFHTAWWHRSWGAEVTIYARRNAEGRIEAGLPIHTARFLGARAVRRPPFTPLNGPVFVPPGDASRYARGTSIKREVLLAIQACPKLGLYDFVLGPDTQDLTPYLWNGFDTLAGYTYVIPRAEADRWAAHMADTHKRNLRKARKELDERAGSVEVDPPIESVAPLLLETADTQGYSMRPYAQRVPAWWHAVMKHGAGRSYLVRDGDDRALCATLMVFDRRTAYYLAGGMLSELRRSSRLNMLLFESMIRDAHALGLDFDFEGSTLPGVERFFRGWGGELRLIPRVVKIPSPFAFLLWQAHRYWKRHHRRRWVWHD